MPAPSPVPIRAAGAVLWRRSGDGAEVALRRRSGGAPWGLPRVPLDPGETELEAAVRAAAPAAVTPGRCLGATRDETDADGRARRRITAWWAVRAASSEPGPDQPGGDTLRWVALSEATGAVEDGSDRVALERFGSGPAQVGRIVLLRHCEAEQWRDGDDHVRPLTAVGRSRARRLAGVVAALRVDELLASPARRCLDTLEPAALATGLALADESMFAEGEPDRDKAAAVLDQRGRAGASALVCTHAPVIGGLLERFAAERPALLPRPARLDAGGAWCVEFTADGPAAMHYLPPPPAEGGG